MASTITEGSIEEEIRIVRRKYRWPAGQLNFWLLIMLVASSTVLGIFANFCSIQGQLDLGTPWYFTYNVTIGGLGVVFIIVMLYLISQKSLLPGIVILGSFILFVLWMVGLIATSIELWGPQGNVNASCNMYVTNMEYHGQSLETLAWLQQNNICQSWKAVFAFQLIGTVFLLWMMIMSYQVYKDE